MWIRRNEEDVRRLHEEALELLSQGDVDGARAIATELRDAGWAGAYEILALAARQAGDLEGAVSVLDEGVRLAPTAWLLHQLRGNLLDAVGRKDDALAAFDAALACPEPWVSSVRYNRAVTRLGAGDPGGALEDATHVFEDPSSPPFGLDAIRVAVDALAKLNRTEDAVSLVRFALAEGGDAAQAQLEALRARALARAEHAIEEVREAASRAIEGGAGSAELAAWLEPVSDDERPLRLLKVIVEGETAAAKMSAPRTKFLRVLVVAAADEGEALLWAQAIEPAVMRGTMRLEKSEDQGATEPPRGIRHATGRIAFEE